LGYNRYVMGCVGIYSGTFDPVHEGHLDFCLEAIKSCELDVVYMIPEANPRGKANAADLSERIDWLQEATKNYPFIKVMRLESERFTVGETLPELRQLFGDVKMKLLIGSDVARNLYLWEDLPVLLNDVSLVVGVRGKDTADDVEVMMRRAGERNSVKYEVVKTRYPHVSSTKIRGIRAK
jgi:nicotinate-nucleotide adenylyltransferase